MRMGESEKRTLLDRARGRVSSSSRPGSWERVANRPAEAERAAGRCALAGAHGQSSSTGGSMAPMRPCPVVTDRQWPVSAFHSGDGRAVGLGVDDVAEPASNRHATGMAGANQVTGGNGGSRPCAADAARLGTATGPGGCSDRSAHLPRCLHMRGSILALASPGWTLATRSCH